MKTLSVSEIVFAIKNRLEDEFPLITVEGEVSNLSGSAAGHFYFTLSDKDSSLSCALFKMDAMRNPFIRKCRNGDKVVISGPISVYAKRGSFQLLTKRITPAGKGDLKAQFEALKAKLNAEGLFDIQRKQAIPVLPKRVAVITALGRAALQDFLNIIKRRSSWYDVTIIPAVVQGDKCPSSIIKAIKKAEEKNEYDVLVITRGGGSLEDLWGFNDEGVVRAASDCKVPIISAIGHQVDFSLLDLVSDLRCETPSSAAEVLTTEQVRLKDRLRQNAKSLRSHAIEFKSVIERKISNLNPLNTLSLLIQKLHSNQSKLRDLNIFEQADPLSIYENFQHIDVLSERLKQKTKENTLEKKNQLSQVKAVLDSLSPTKVLERGYTMMENENGKVLTSYKEFAKIEDNSNLKIHFHDGSGNVKKSESKSK